MPPSISMMYRLNMFNTLFLSWSTFFFKIFAGEVKPPCFTMFHHDVTMMSPCFPVKSPWFRVARPAPGPFWASALLGSPPRPWATTPQDPIVHHVGKAIRKHPQVSTIYIYILIIYPYNHIYIIWYNINGRKRNPMDPYGKFMTLLY